MRPDGRPGPSPDATILFVGQLRRYKGLRYLIRAFQELRRRNGRCKLVIVGEGPDRGPLSDEVKKLGLEDCVSLLGGIDDAQLEETYANSRVLVLPSVRGESFGIVLLEAAAHGMPVIASELPGVREVVQSLDGILVPPGDSAALAAALAKALEKPNGDGSRHLVFTRFLWGEIAREYLNSYREILGDGESANPGSRASVMPQLQELSNHRLPAQSELRGFRTEEIVPRDRSIAERFVDSKSEVTDVTPPAPLPRAETNHVVGMKEEIFEKELASTELSASKEPVGGVP